MCSPQIKILFQLILFLRFVIETPTYIPITVIKNNPNKNQHDGYSQCGQNKTKKKA